MRPLVLVTGGAGFIGSHVVDVLVERGYRVRVYDKLVEQVHGDAGPCHVHEDAEFVHGDMLDEETLRQALVGVNAIVHDAAEVGVGQSMYEIRRYVGANTGGTAVLLELLANETHSVERIVVASSMSIYGEGAYVCDEHGAVSPGLRGSEQLANKEWEAGCPVCGVPVAPVATPESKPLQPTSIYAISKMDQELMCLAVGAAYGIDVVALRYFNTYGARQSLSNPYTGVGAIFSSRLLNGRPPLVFEDGLQLRDFVHVSDIARANLLALETTSVRGEAINIGSGDPVSVLDVAHSLAARLDVDLAPDVMERARSGDIRHCWADIGKARTLLGYEPSVRFDDGMAELVEWVRKQTADDRVQAAHAELVARGLA
jgi:dTDP-L-rhamnose 4-epimerase